MMPYVLVQVLQMIIPPLIRVVINHYTQKEQTPIVAATLAAHQSALDSLTPKGQVK
jgi:hypothetical protein